MAHAVKVGNKDVISALIKADADIPDEIFISVIRSDDVNVVKALLRGVSPSVPVLVCGIQRNGAALPTLISAAAKHAGGILTPALCGALSLGNQAAVGKLVSASAVRT